MNILFCAYRTWAVNAFKEIQDLHPGFNITLASNQEEFYHNTNKYRPDLIVLVGWSWIVPKEIVDAIYTVGFHPSDLPDYAGGSPIQHQIIDGIEKTRGSLFRATSKLDMGPIVYKEDLSLSGNMADIFVNLSLCAISLVDRLLCNYPSVPSVEQKNSAEARKRLKPADSRLTKDRIFGMSSKELYDFIRCREEPYPNVFIEDEVGILYLEKVGYKFKGKNDG